MPHFKPNDDDTDIGAQYGREVLFEIIYVGNLAKVNAIDAETGIEVSIVGPPNATKYSLQMNAMRKLIRVLNKTEGAERDEGFRKYRRPGWYA